MKVGYISRQNQNFIFYKILFLSIGFEALVLLLSKTPERPNLSSLTSLLYDSPVLIFCQWAADFLKYRLGWLCFGVDEDAGPLSEDICHRSCCRKCLQFLLCREGLQHPALCAHSIPPGTSDPTMVFLVHPLSTSCLLGYSVFLGSSISAAEWQNPPHQHCTCNLFNFCLHSAPNGAGLSQISVMCMCVCTRVCL